MSATDEDRPELRELAREEPEAVQAVADRAGGRLGSWLWRILEEEQGETGTSASSEKR